MDFGIVGLEGLVGSETTSSGFASLASSDPETKHKWYGSGFLKQERSGTTEDDWRSSKLSKTESMLLPAQRNTLLKSNTSTTAAATTTSTLFTDGQQQQQMLSFSCPKSEALSAERIPQNATLPYFHLTSSAYAKNTGTTVSNTKALTISMGYASLFVEMIVIFFGSLWGSKVPT